MAILYMENMILNELNFSKIYCVNLPSRPDRRQNAINQFNKIGLKGYQFFNAIDGRELNLKAGSAFLNPAMVGCYLSHYLIIREAIENNYESILVFEDDINFIVGAATFLDYAIPTVPADWEFIYLGYTVYPKEIKNTKILSDYWAIPGHCWGTHAYAVRGNGIAKLWQGLKHITNQIDIQLSYEILKNQQLQYYAIYPTCAQQNITQFGTDIQKKAKI
jgi:GR25 family glycosyltransferase involved in LPS biosynthesis